MCKRPFCLWGPAKSPHKAKLSDTLILVGTLYLVSHQDIKKHKLSHIHTPARINYQVFIHQLYDSHHLFGFIY